MEFTICVNHWAYFSCCLFSFQKLVCVQILDRVKTSPPKPTQFRVMSLDAFTYNCADTYTLTVSMTIC